MRRFSRALLSAMMPEVTKGVLSAGKFLLNDLSKKDGSNMTRTGGLNLESIGRGLASAGKRVGQKLLEDLAQDELPASQSLHPGKTQMLIYDPFRNAKISADKLSEIIVDPNASEAERKWAIRKDKKIRKKYKVQV